MKLRVRIDTEQLCIDETVEGETADDIWRQVRRELERRAPLLARTVIRAMSDYALWARMTELHNRRSGAQERVPASAGEFMALGERAGYVTRLE